MDKSIVNVYCCGGAGVNIGTSMYTYHNNEIDGFSKLQLKFIDTSVANLRGSSIEDEDCFIIEGRGDGRDGSGGIRAENVNRIKEKLPALLVAMPPAKYNIVIFSGSGGSGSTIGPTLISRLLEEDCVVVGMVVSDATSVLYSNNSVNTLKSLTGVVGKHDGRSLPIYSYVNKPGMNELDINKRVVADLGLLSILFSEEIKRLDYADIYNWANQERVTKIKAPLTLVNQLNFGADGVQVDKNKHDAGVEASTLVTGISVKQSDAVITPMIKLPYAKTGILVHSLEDFFGDSDETFMLACSSDIESVYRELADTKVQDEKLMKARSQKSMIDVSDADDDGMVL